MAKKVAQKKQVQTKIVRQRKPLHAELQGSQMATEEGEPSAFAQSVLEHAAQGFSSEEQAVTFLLKSVTDKLGESEDEKAQMHEFLTLILDTDPTLKEEILQGVAITK